MSSVESNPITDLSDILWQVREGYPGEQRSQECRGEGWAAAAGERGPD